MRLLEDDPSTTIPPLVDVVLNGLGAIFILLMLYIILVPSDDADPIAFLEGIDPAPGIRGQSYMFTFPVTGGAANRRFTLVGDLPEGLAFDSTSGTIYGLPPAQRGGGSAAAIPFDLEVGVTDDRSRDDRSATLLLHPTALPYPGALAFTTDETVLGKGRVGVPYSDALGAEGGVEPYVWRIVEGVLPPGLRIGNGRITGTPQTAGTFEFTAEVAHSTGGHVYQGRRFEWSGEQDRRDLRIDILGRLSTEPRLPAGRMGEPYAGGVLVASPLLPNERVEWQGLEQTRLVASGNGDALSGRPAADGVYEVGYVVLRDSVEVERRESLELRVLPRRPAPGAGGILIQTEAGTPIDAPVPYWGLEEPVTMRPLNDLPEGLALSDGRLRGRREEPGLETVAIRVEDAVGMVVSGTIGIRMAPARTSLDILTAGAVRTLVGQPVAITLSAAGGEGSYAWSATDLPAGLTLDERGVLGGTIASPGTWTANVAVTDRISGERTVRTLEIRAEHADPSVPRITTSELPVAVVGQPYRFDLSAAGGIGTYTWTVAPSGPLPAGLALTATGVTGTPESTDTTDLAVTVEDEVGSRGGPSSLGLVVVDPTAEFRDQLSAAATRMDSMSLRIQNLEAAVEASADTLVATERTLADVTDQAEDLAARVRKLEAAAPDEGPSTARIAGALLASLLAVALAAYVIRRLVIRYRAAAARHDIPVEEQSGGENEGG